MGSQRAKHVALHTGLGLTGIMMIMPFIWMISTSLKPESQVMLFPPEWIPEPFVFANYVQAWTSAPFLRFYGNSVFVASSVTLGQLATCSMGAYAFARLRFPGRDRLFLLYLATLMIPFQVTMVPAFIIVRFMGWLDQYPALVVPALFSPYGTFLLRQFFKTIPIELEEAVRIDGGGYLDCFRYIILPLSKPALAALGTFVFLWSWNDFLWPLIVTNSMDMKTVPLGIAYFQGQYTTYWNLMMAAATIALVPVLIVFVLAQKYFVEGITLTGLKG